MAVEQQFLLGRAASRRGLESVGLPIATVRAVPSRFHPLRVPGARSIPTLQARLPALEPEVTRASSPALTRATARPTGGNTCTFEVYKTPGWVCRAFSDKLPTSERSRSDYGSSRWCGSRLLVSPSCDCCIDSGHKHSLAKGLKQIVYSSCSQAPFSRTGLVICRNDNYRDQNACSRQMVLKL